MMENPNISLKRKINLIEEAAIKDALSGSGWVKAKAARMLGITERMIGYKIKKYGIKREVNGGGSVQEQ